jgi:hypothetical protein
MLENKIGENKIQKLFEENTIKLFISVKIDSVNKEKDTLDHLIAQKIKALIEEKNKEILHPNKKISVFLSSDENTQEAINNQEYYRKSIESALSDADALLFICSNVDYLNNSRHIKDELNGFFTLKAKLLKPQNSFFKITSREFDAEEGKIEKTLRPTIAGTNNFFSFRSKTTENLTNEHLEQKANDFIKNFNAPRTPNGNKLDRFVKILLSIQNDSNLQVSENDSKVNRIALELAYNLGGFEIALKNWVNNSENYPVINSKEFDFKTIFEDDQFDLETLTELHSLSKNLLNEINRIGDLNNPRVELEMDNMLSSHKINTANNSDTNSINYINAVLGNSVVKFKDSFRKIKTGFFTKKIIESLKKSAIKENIRRFDNFKDNDINDIFQTFWGINKTSKNTYIYKQSVKFTKLKGNKFGRKEIGVIVIK